MKKLKKERRINLMKKTKLIVFFMLLGIGIYFLIPLKVYANSFVYGNADYLYSYLTQFRYGYAEAAILHPVEWDDDDERFVLFLEEEPSHVIEQNYFEFNLYDLHYFEPSLADVIEIWVNLEFQYGLEYLIDYELEIEDFDGYLYWNFQEKYWQIDYYMTSEIDYYIQRIEYLENLVTNLSNDLYLRGIEIHELQIEIQNLEDLLDTEFDRGYVAGYNVGYDVGFDDGILAGEPEAYEEGFKAGEKSKLAENNEAFYNGIGKWLVPAIIAVIVLGGIVSITAIKRREP